MNYLSHFVLDRHRQDAAFSVGGCLPDLCRMRGEGFRLKVPKVDQQAGDLMMASVQDGIRRHHQIDAWWHSAPVFETLTQDLKNSLASQGIRVGRGTFLIHIGAEILLDAAMLGMEPELTEQFYDCFSTATKVAALDVAAANGGAAHLPKLDNEWDRFVRRRFLADYKDHTYLDRTWRGIYQHVTGEQAIGESLAWQAVISEQVEASLGLAKELLLRPQTLL